jgi:hypothetical protein
MRDMNLIDVIGLFFVIVKVCIDFMQLMINKANNYLSYQITIIEH